MTPAPAISKYEHLTPDNAVIIMLDQQTGLMSAVQSQAMSLLKNNVIALAEIAKQMSIPVILTTSFSDGPNGPILKELTEMFPKEPVLNRTLVNAWMDKDFRNAIDKTGRKKLIIAGITTDVCVAFPAIDAVGDGYDVHAVVDCSGTWSDLAETASMMRMAQAGVRMNWVAVAGELLRDWKDQPVGPQIAQIFNERLQGYSYLITTLAAQQKAK